MKTEPVMDLLIAASSERSSDRIIQACLVKPDEWEDDQWSYFQRGVLAQLVETVSILEEKIHRLEKLMPVLDVDDD